MKYGRNVRQALVMITQFGIDMMVPIALCSLAGYWLDRHFGTSWIFVALFFVGAAAGAGNVYRFAKRIYSSGSGDIRNRDLTDMADLEAQDDEADREEKQ